MVSAFWIVKPPKPPESRQLISPPAAVFEIAPANVLHGAVRLHGLTSSPTPETQVRVAWAEAAAGMTSASSAISRADLMRLLVTTGRAYVRPATGVCDPLNEGPGSASNGAPQCERFVLPMVPFGVPLVPLPEM